MSDITHIISFSGGLSSFMASVRVVRDVGYENVLLVFTDTKTEDEDLYRFLAEAKEYLSPAEYVHLADGRDIWQVFQDEKYMGNNRRDPCSKILKRLLFHKWVRKNFKPGECILYYGLSWDESHRLKRLREYCDPYQVVAPLTEKPYMVQEDMMAFVKDINIKPPRLYSMGFPHNNCGGFCVKTGQAQFKLLYEKMPERYLYHEQKQEELFELLGKKHPFIRMTIDGKLKYLSLKEFRKILESDKNNQIDLFDFGGCGCFVD